MTLLTPKSSDSRFEEELKEIFLRTPERWSELRGQRIFLTGGTGFFGCCLLESLLAANAALALDCRFTVLSRNPEVFAKRNPRLAGNPVVELLQGDVRAFDYPKDEFGYIIHGATESASDLTRTNPGEMLSVIVDGTKRVLDFAAHCHAQKFLFISSGAIYGRQPANVSHLTEDQAFSSNPSEPLSSYTEGKRKGEALCTEFAQARGIAVKIARCFAFVGPYLPLDSHFAIGNFIRDRMAGKAIEVESDGTAVRSYLYASDLCQWLWTILLAGASCRPYNVGSEQAISIAELAKLIAESAEPPLKFAIKRQADANASIHRYVPSTARAQTELGLRQRIDLHAAIRSTISWNQDRLT